MNTMGIDTRFPIEPLGSRVIVRPDPEPPDEKVSAGGVILIKLENMPVTTGRLVALGGDAYAELEEGKRVIFSPYAGFQLTVRGEVYVILDTSEILGYFMDDTESDAQVR